MGSRGRRRARKRKGGVAHCVLAPSPAFAILDAQHAENRNVRYGGQNAKQQKCAQCEQSPDKHTIKWIESSRTTDKLMERLIDGLEKVDLKGIELGKTPEKSEIMAGALAGTIEGGKTLQYVALSGPNGALLKKVASLGKDVTFVLGDLGLTGGKSIDVRGNLFAPKSAGKLPNKLGNCAAQKVLHAFFGDAKKAEKKVQKIEMTEMFWRSFTHTGEKNQKWSTIEAVESCDTCKQVVPQMLCDKVDVAMRS